MTDELKACDDYNEGYQTGLHWCEDWIPGGPWYCMCEKCCEESKKKSAAWRKGFNDATDTNTRPSEGGEG